MLDVKILLAAVASFSIGMLLLVALYFPLQYAILETRYGHENDLYRAKYGEPVQVIEKPILYGADTRLMGSSSNVTLTVYSGGIVTTSINFKSADIQNDLIDDDKNGPYDLQFLEGKYMINFWCDKPRLEIVNATELNVVNGFGHAFGELKIPAASYEYCSLIIDGMERREDISAYWRYLTISG